MSFSHISEQFGSVSVVMVHNNTVKAAGTVVSLLAGCKKAHFGRLLAAKRRFWGAKRHFYTGFCYLFAFLRKMYSDDLTGYVYENKEVTWILWCCVNQFHWNSNV